MKYKKNRKPNIILIVIDSLRADKLSCYGYHKSTSPNIDKISEKSILFKNAFASAPWTLPSHTSLFTGKFPLKHGVDNINNFLDNKNITLAETLSGIGYDTIGLANNGWLSKSTNLNKGFNKFYEKPKKNSNLIEMAKDYIKKKKEKPFFLFMNLMDVHMPYIPDKSLFKDFELDKYNKERINYLQKEFVTYRVFPEKLSKEDLKILNKLYDASLATVDKKIGQFNNFLKKEVEDYILIITSDHGEEIGEHISEGIYGHWLCLYDTLLRVPLIIYDSKKEKRKKISKLAQQHNLFYTILEYCGKKIKEKKLFKNCKYVFSEHEHPKKSIEYIHKLNKNFGYEDIKCAKKSIRSKKYKYILYENGKEKLFNISNDCYERKNLINKEIKLKKKLKNKIFKKLGHFDESHSTKNDIKFEDSIKKD
ncbi:sulfatase-like hydrolase/transferase [Candidatus Dependentiae bacterium]|nr:sulfatase-like hydrolase/transferase [Candidatus Dependentiae bacterium]